MLRFTISPRDGTSNDQSCRQFSCKALRRRKTFGLLCQTTNRSCQDFPDGFPVVSLQCTLLPVSILAAHLELFSRRYDLAGKGACARPGPNLDVSALLQSCAVRFLSFAGVLDAGCLKFDLGCVDAASLVVHSGRCGIMWFSWRSSRSPPSRPCGAGFRVAAC